MLILKYLQIWHVGLWWPLVLAPDKVGGECVYGGPPLGNLVSVSLGRESSEQGAHLDGVGLGGGHKQSPQGNHGPQLCSHVARCAVEALAVPHSIMTQGCGPDIWLWVVWRPSPQGIAGEHLWGDWTVWMQAAAVTRTPLTVEEVEGPIDVHASSWGNHSLKRLCANRLDRCHQTDKAGWLRGDSRWKDPSPVSGGRALLSWKGSALGMVSFLPLALQASPEEQFGAIFPGSDQQTRDIGPWL